MGLLLPDNIIADHAEGQQAAVDAGAPAAIVAAMSAHHCAFILEQGCRALASLVAFFPAGQQAAVTAGAPDAIFTAMVRTDSSDSASRAALCQWGCLALCRIAQCFNADDVGAQRVGGAQAIEAILDNFEGALRTRIPTATLSHPANDQSGVGRDSDVVFG